LKSDKAKESKNQKVRVKGPMSQRVKESKIIMNGQEWLKVVEDNFKWSKVIKNWLLVEHLSKFP
jgi:hypothetical protein